MVQLLPALLSSLAFQLSSPVRFIRELSGGYVRPGRHRHRDCPRFAVPARYSVTQGRWHRRKASSSTCATPSAEAISPASDRACTQPQRTQDFMYNKIYRLRQADFRAVPWARLWRGPAGRTVYYLHNPLQPPLPDRHARPVCPADNQMPVPPADAPAASRLVSRA